MMRKIDGHQVPCQNKLCQPLKAPRRTRMSPEKCSIYEKDIDAYNRATKLNTKRREDRQRNRFKAARIARGEEE